MVKSRSRRCGYLNFKAVIGDGKKQKMLIVDSREQAVIPFLGSIEHVVQQITVGDYAIMLDERIVGIIERKTLADYGASIIDGRVANKSKLLDLRAKTGARIFYIVEGDMNPAPDTVYGGVKYSSIYSSMLHLMTEFGIIVWRVKTTKDAALWIGDLCRSFAARPPRDEVCPESKYETHNGAEISGSHESFLTMRVEKAMFDRRVELWSALPGIGSVTAVLLAGHAPMDLLRNASIIQTMKISERAIGSIRLLTVRDSWNVEQERFLGAIKGMGKKRIGELRAKYASLFEYCRYLFVNIGLGAHDRDARNVLFD